MNCLTVAQTSVCALSWIYEPLYYILFNDTILPLLLKNISEYFFESNRTIFIFPSKVGYKSKPDLVNMYRQTFCEFNSWANG